MQTIYSADAVFNGLTFLPHHAVITENEKIVSVLPIVSLPDNSEINAHVPILTPAFIDLQIYGAGGRLFSVYPDVETLVVMQEYCYASGSHRFLPTIATNTREVIYKAIDAVKAYQKSGKKSVPGIHLEGPWINPLKRGAHMESLIHTPTISELKELLAYAEGSIAMITLAPECCDPEVIELLKAESIVISAGHSNATFNEAMKGFENGIQVVTHMYNAMSAFNHRDPGLAAAAMMHGSVMSSIIVDGHHVDYNMVRLAKKTMNNRLFLITDSVTATPDGPYPHEADGNKYIANGVLSGSSLTMLQAIKNCVKYASIELKEALRMASVYPAKVMGLENTQGRIAVGYDACFIGLDKEINIVATS